MKGKKILNWLSMSVIGSNSHALVNGFGDPLNKAKL